MGRSLIRKEDVQKVWLLFRELKNPPGFLEVVRLAVQRGFVPDQVPMMGAGESLIGSKDYAALLDIMGTLAQIKSADFNFFISLVSDICWELVSGPRPAAFRLKNGALVHLRSVIPLKRRLLAFLPYCLSYINPPDGRFYFVTNIGLEEVVGRHVGLCPIVKTDEKDRVVYGRKDDKGKLTRFVRNRRSEPTFDIWLSLIADRSDDSDGEFFLRGAGFGRKPPTTPDKTSSIYQALDPATRKKCRDFWREHAIVLPKDTELALEFPNIPPQWDI
jgi:hypothetical protein